MHDKNNTMLRYTDDVEDAKKYLASAVVKALSDATASATDESGTFEVIISTEDVDRHGDVVRVDGWDTTNYMNNPVVLCNHEWWDLPVGMCTELRTEGNKLIAKGKFAPADANPKAQMVRKLYDLGMMRATSVGFIPVTIEEGNIITQAELLEFSFVTVPANPNALSIATEKGMNIERMKTLGLIVEAKEEGGEAQTGETPTETVETPVVAPETATDDATPAPETKSAETVQEVVDQREAREMKWENFEKVDEIVSAFWSVYFNDETPVEDFDRLLSETVSLLSEIVAEPEVQTKMVSSVIETKKLTKMSLSIIKDATETSEEQKATEETPPQTEQTPVLEEVQTPPEGGDEKVESTGDATIAKEYTVDEYRELKKALQNIATLTSETLAKHKYKKTK